MIDRLVPAPKILDVPKYIDVILLLQDVDYRTRINKVLDRSEGYIMKSLSTLHTYGLITFSQDENDSKQLVINLTTKGKKVKQLLLQLYTCMDIKLNYGWMENFVGESK